jgi:hypothetical protein
MSTCNCGIDKPKPLEGKKYADVETAYDTMSKSFQKKKISNFEFFLIIILILLSFILLREYKIIC